VTAVGTGRTQCWLQAVSGAIYLSVICTANASVYMLQAAIYSTCSFIIIFATKYRTLLHVVDVRTR